MRILGLSCKASEIRGVVCDINGTVLNTARLAVSLKSSKLNYIGKVQSLINILAQHHCRVDGVGIAFAGEVDKKSGLVLFAPGEMNKHAGTDLFAVAKAVTDSNIMVENEVRASLIGEHWLGSAANYNSAFMLALDDYIDAAVIIGGRITAGKPDLNEFRLPDRDGIDRDLDCYISAKAMSKKMQNALGRNACREEYLEEYLGGNREIYRVLYEFSENLTAAIRKIKEIYNPEAVIIGGEFSEWYPNFIPFVEAQLKEHKISIAVEKTRFGHDSACIGAVCLCRENILAAHK
ncbi:MAG TPA: ROK family protein [Candidatus Avimonas sp.]|nr:ROK family protein [Candidatus Avimonas sp.]